MARRPGPSGPGGGRYTRRAGCARTAIRSSPSCSVARRRPVLPHPEAPLHPVRRRHPEARDRPAPLQRPPRPLPDSLPGDGGVHVDHRPVVEAGPLAGQVARGAPLQPLLDRHDLQLRHQRQRLVAAGPVAGDQHRRHAEVGDEEHVHPQLAQAAPVHHLIVDGERAAVRQVSAVHVRLGVLPDDEGRAEAGVAAEGVAHGAPGQQPGRRVQQQGVDRPVAVPVHHQELRRPRLHRPLDRGVRLQRRQLPPHLVVARVRRAVVGAGDHPGHALHVRHDVDLHRAPARPAVSGLPSTYRSMATAAPSFALSGTTAPATRRTPSGACPIATPSPASASISRSL